MNIIVSKNETSLGLHAAQTAADILKNTIAQKGKARLVLSTGASQLTTIAALVKQDVPWDRVEMFHLDEYVGLPQTHPASFRKYLTERFINAVHPGKAFLVDGTEENIAALTREIRREPVDLGLIGIGENAHIAFNDPPADIETQAAFFVVDLDEACKRQQVGEGWFDTVGDVPRQAVSMTVYQILQCRTIISCVPYAVKSGVMKRMLESDVTNLIPATYLKPHPDFHLFVDSASFGAVQPETILDAPGMPKFTLTYPEE